MHSRFDYIAYDEIAIQQQASAKDACKRLEDEILDLKQSRATSLALTKLEEAYMWIGKAIRDQQIERNLNRSNE